MVPLEVRWNHTNVIDNPTNISGWLQNTLHFVLLKHIDIKHSCRFSGSVQVSVVGAQLRSVRSAGRALQVHLVRGCVQE